MLDFYGPPNIQINLTGLTRIFSDKNTTDKYNVYVSGLRNVVRYLSDFIVLKYNSYLYRSS